MAVDVYLRDNTSDDGTEPSSGPLSQSPDIVPRHSQVTNAQASFESLTPPEAQDIFEGRTNWVYLLARNDGSDVADGVQANVWWSPPSTLGSGPWNHIGGQPLSIPGGGMTVAEIVWSSGVPARGHYCFIATLNAPGQPGEQVGDGAPGDFAAWVRNHNNVAWRNFNVVPWTASAMMMPFFIGAHPKRGLPFAIDIEVKFPAGAVVALEVPRVLDRIAQHLPSHDVVVQPKAKAIKQAVQLPVERRRIQLRSSRNALGKLVIEAGVPIPAAIRVQLDGPLPRAPGLVSVVQRYQGVEIGRITWKLLHPDKLKQTERYDKSKLTAG